MSEEESAVPPLSPLLLPRREPFEYGLLPIPKLIFTDGTLTLIPLRDKLLSNSSPTHHRVNAQTVADALEISFKDANLVIETLSSVLPSDLGRDEEHGVNVYDLIVFLYIQSYKRLVPRPYKDAAAVADVWPSMSAFDGCLSALSPMQVPTLERLQHLEFLIQFVEKGCEVVPFSQAFTLYAKLDQYMPSFPAPATQVLEWVLQNIAGSLDRILDQTPTKEKGSTCAVDLNMTSADAPMNISMSYSRSQTVVEGISKSSVVKHACDIKGHSIKVLNCHDSVIYILAPLRYATVYGCSESTIVLGATGKAVRVEHCERVHIIAAARRICISNCRDCVFFLGVNQQPLIIGDNHKLQVAPYNTFYPQLEEHMTQVGIKATVNRWNEPHALGMVDPHDSISHPAGASDVQAESATCLDPDQFTSFLIPNSFGAESAGLAKDNPFPLPETYMASQKGTHSVLSDIQQVIRNAQIEENKKRELACALHVHFKDWLYASGNIRQLYCLQ